MLPLLQELTAADEEQRKSILAKMITENYIEPMRVSEAHGTSKDLEDAFRNSYPSIASADTRRKAITFYLHSARMAGIELSAHFPKTRSGSGAPGVPRVKKMPRRKAGSFPQERIASELRGSTLAEDGDTYTVELASGGSVSVVVRVNLFDLTTEDRNFVIGLVDKLKGYPNPTTESRSQEVSS